MRLHCKLSYPWVPSSVAFDAILCDGWLQTEAAIPPPRDIPAVTPFKSHSCRNNLIEGHMAPQIIETC